MVFSGPLEVYFLSLQHVVSSPLVLPEKQSVPTILHCDPLSVLANGIVWTAWRVTEG